MHTFRIGPTFTVNAKSKTANNRKESDMNNEENAAPEVINSFKSPAEVFVDDWYRKHEEELKTQSQAEKRQFIPPAPPSLLGIEEKK